MTRIFALLALVLLTACADLALPLPEFAGRRDTSPSTLPAMKTFATARPARPVRSNAALAQDFLDLAFMLESGRELPVLTRFEGPVTLRVNGSPPAGMNRDLARLLGRLRAEAGIDITQVSPGTDANITVQVVPRGKLQRAVPQAACFVVPRISSWEEFRRNRRGALVDWTTLQTRDRMAIFIPGDVAPQEVRDCLHEEIAQSLGPLNDLYRLSDSVFNDDNFHTVLTGFDMLILRAFYAPELQSGMTRAQVAAKLPGVLARINPGGRKAGGGIQSATGRDWINAIESALGPKTSSSARRSAAKRAVLIANRSGWNDNRLAFSLFVQGRLTLSSDPDLALASFLQSGTIYAASADTQLHAAHVAMQLAAFALSAGDTQAAIGIVNQHAPIVERAENAALLSTLLMVKAEALDQSDRAAEARVVRDEALGWARYGFGDDRSVRDRLSEIAALSQRCGRVPL